MRLSGSNFNTRERNKEGGRKRERENRERLKLQLFCIKNEKWENVFLLKNIVSCVLLESQYKHMIYWDIIYYFHIVNAFIYNIEQLVFYRIKHNKVPDSFLQRFTRTGLYACVLFSFCFFLNKVLKLLQQIPKMMLAHSWIHVSQGQCSGIG